MHYYIFNPKTFTVSHLLTLTQVRVRRAHGRMVGAQSNLAGGKTFLSEIMYAKNNKMPEFYIILM